ncbi:hypothetical protein [Defluviitalea phaphyphila]|uniref:hypothetical protein n=1 Tax=Defluviitalea phaphyphila TaxID=1473580 RepID=UPI0007313B2D|nr:hypothetical protein [Defluviitalea phaphyphila]
MNLKKLNCFLIIFSIIIIPLLYFINDNIELIQAKLINNEINYILRQSSKAIYDLNIPLKNYMISHMKIYKARGIKNNVEDVEYYMKKLNIKGTIQETPTEFKISNKNVELILSKNDGLIQYKNYDSKKEDNKITKEKAIENAINFIKTLNLNCNYQKILVEDIFYKNIYQIRFVNTLEGILNYSYYTKVDISYGGEILNIEHYKLIYEPIKSIEIKSIKKAYNELKQIPLEENIQIDIKKIDLVYVLNSKNENTIEPAYRFFGETNKGNSFEYFISALK